MEKPRAALNWSTTEGFVTASRLSLKIKTIRARTVVLVIRPKTACTLAGSFSSTRSKQTRAPARKAAAPPRKVHQTVRYRTSSSDQAQLVLRKYRRSTSTKVSSTIKSIITAVTHFRISKRTSMIFE